ncbi:hypothetical protein LguiA_010378 [Lonicera macranthoides]
MEDTKPTQTTTPQNDPSLPQKKPADSISHFENSKYFQMRALLKDLRPHFLEVIRTPEYRDCEAATEIREKLKLFMDLYKEMTAETFTLEKCKNEPAADGPKPREQQPQPDKLLNKTPQDLPLFVAQPPENQRLDMQGTYIVGGSAFGWNFITFPGTTAAIYYGRTKEAFRSANVVSEAK